MSKNRSTGQTGFSQKIVLRIILFYQRSKFFYSPFLKSLWLSDGNCRFQPTCSSYCFQAVEKYGTLRGLWLCLRRISRCHPWNKGGVDKLT